jgi:hypothetical protein
MSAAAALLERLKASCLSIGIEGDRLDIRGPDEVLERLPFDELRKHKAELLKLVSLERSPPAVARPPSITDFEERAAILKFDGGLSRSEAGRAAAKELGFPHPRALYMACLKAWRAAIENIAPAHAGTDEERLRAGELTALQVASLAFLAAGDVPLQALSSGWDELQLFGIHEGFMPTARLDAWGLIPLLAWSVLGLELADIDSQHALVVSAGGGAGGASACAGSQGRRRADGLG